MYYLKYQRKFFQMSKVLKHIKPGLNQQTRFEKIHTVIFENSKLASKLIAREIADLILYKQKKNEYYT